MLHESQVNFSGRDMAEDVAECSVRDPSVSEHGDHFVVAVTPWEMPSSQTVE